MEVVAAAPLRAVAFAFQPFQGVYALSVVQKLTFALLPGECALASEQEPIRDEELHWGDDPRRSLRAPSDVAPFKRRADILLVGSAFAPGGRPVRTLTVRLSAAGMTKAIEVHGPRLFTVNNELREGAPWSRMPLRYERAAGGPDTWNPAGVWLDGPRDPYGQRHLPNLQPEGVELREATQFVPPIGLGPIASSWPFRTERLRGRADITSPLAARAVPLGEDFDASYFQDAPFDQQVASIRPDEAIVLEHLHPEHERFVTRLPGLRPTAHLELAGESAVEIPLQADTLWIDTDRSLCTLTFRGHVAIADPNAKGVVRARLLDDDTQEANTDEALPVRTAEIQVALPSAPTEITAVQPPSPMTSALPFTGEPGSRSAPVQPADEHGLSTANAAAPAAPSPRGKTLLQGSVRSPAPRARTARQNTEEVVIPPGALAGPSWLSPDRAAQASAPPAAPSPPAAGTAPAPPAAVAAPAPAPPALVAAAPAPPAPVPPAVVLPAAPRSGLQISLGDLSTQALSATGPVLRSQPKVAEDLKLGDVDEKALRSAAAVGVLAASNAAAGPGKKDVARAATESAATDSPGETAYLELLHFDRSIVPRLRAHPVFSASMRPPPKAPPTQQGKPPPPPPTPEAIEKAERADLHRVLSLDPDAAAEPSEPDDEPPLVLAQGTLSFPFDEIDVLEAAIACAKPLASSDKKLKEALDLAAELLRSDLDSGEAAEAITSRIRDMWSRVPRPKDSPPLDARIEQRLLEERKYQRRSILDGSFLRAHLALPGRESVVAYLPAKLETRLPLFARFPARVLAELYPCQDPTEKSSVALKVAALARVTARPRLARPAGGP